MGEVRDSSTVTYYKKTMSWLAAKKDHLFFQCLDTFSMVRWIGGG